MRVKTREWSGIWIVLQYALTCLLERDGSPSPARAHLGSLQELKTRSGLWKVNLLPDSGEDKRCLYFPLSPLYHPVGTAEARSQHGGPVFLPSQKECAEMLRIHRRPPAGPPLIIVQFHVLPPSHPSRQNQFVPRTTLLTPLQYAVGGGKSALLARETY